MLNRPPVSEEMLQKTFSALGNALASKIKKHGNGAYASPHEMLGIIQEEWDEYKLEVKNNDIPKQIDELLDIAVGCVFSVASLMTLSDVEEISPDSTEPQVEMMDDGAQLRGLKAIEKMRKRAEEVRAANSQML